jgi:Ankyrin repeats (3 copies)
MDVQDNVEAVAGQNSASPDQPGAKPDGGNRAMTPNGIRLSSPTLAQELPMDLDARSVSGAEIEDSGQKSDSDAETIVLPGKDGHSPSRVRKSIKHEDKSDDEVMADAPDIKDLAEQDDDAASRAEKATMATSLGKRKRTKNGTNKDDPAHLGNSSGLSSVPTSPVATTRSSLSKPAASDSDLSKSPSPPTRPAIRDKAKSADRVPSRRKQYASGSGDEDDADAESQRLGRQRSSGADHKANRDGRSSSKLQVDNTSRKRTRSISPHPRGHRRSISTQLPSKSSHGLSHKKKRVPAPLQSTEYHSDDSSASGNSHPRSSRLRNLAAPTTGESAISPAKMPPHKKHVNSSGQTLLAIACSRGKLDIVKQRYEERPEDVNLADNALNTPLHIASLEGFVDIVQFLIDTGCCELDAVNDLKDTPLHDAVDNKNVEVVKLLLDAGANPSLANTEGNEPLDKISVYGEGDDENDEDDEDSKEDREKASEMRAAIMAAKQKFTSAARRGSEDQMHENGESRLSHQKESPRQTPPAFETQTSMGRMGGTARRIKTSNSHLWMTANPATLQKAASEGDVGAISQILSVNPNLNDAKALFNAARGGHDAVINLLFALGKFNADPAPLEGMPLEQSTPILAAIGKDKHLEVIKLFLAQSDFNPTRRHRGETYYEIAKRKGGPKWQEEETLLKEAFDNYQRTHKSSPTKPRSPGLRRDAARDMDRDSKKSARNDDYQAPSHKRSASSPKSKEVESNKSRHRSTSSLTQSKDGQPIGKRGPGRPRKEENISTTLSDRETSPLAPPNQKSQSKKAESDTPLSESDPMVKPRRKLVTRGERELEKQRRASIASNASSASVKDKRERGSSDTKSDRPDGKSSPNIPRLSKSTTSGVGDRELTSDKQSSEKDRARSLKRDDSKDRLNAIRGESPVKRPRKSETPPRSSMQEVTPAYGSGGSPQKRRKVDAETATGQKSENTPSSSPEHRTTLAKTVLSRENTSGKLNTESKAKSARSGTKSIENFEGAKDSNSGDKVSSSRSAKSANSSSSSVSDPPQRKSKHFNDRPPKEQSDIQTAQIKIEEEDALRQAQLRREKKEAEAARQKELEDEKEREKEKERIEAARQARVAREQAAREEEEKRQREETERKERQQREDAEAHSRAMEEQRILYLEQERLKREELERRRAAALEQQRIERARIEKERREERLAKLPLLLKWFDQASDPQTAEIANLFKRIAGYRYDTIKPEATGQAIGREQWMLNIHVAILLGEKELQLSRCELVVDICKWRRN